MCIFLQYYIIYRSLISFSIFKSFPQLEHLVAFSMNLLRKVFFVTLLAQATVFLREFAILLAQVAFFWRFNKKVVVQMSFVARKEFLPHTRFTKLRFFCVKKKLLVAYN